MSESDRSTVRVTRDTLARLNDELTRQSVRYIKGDRGAMDGSRGKPSMDDLLNYLLDQVEGRRRRRDL